jgi:hypothetical protein
MNNMSDFEDNHLGKIEIKLEEYDFHPKETWLLSENTKNKMLDNLVDIEKCYNNRPPDGETKWKFKDWANTYRILEDWEIDFIEECYE